uniref:Membrane magnesium transporter n=1 Tax=Hucho hucho TaxID=62062 RepID=A0A4W5MUZ1_9TELE
MPTALNPIEEEEEELISLVLNMVSSFWRGVVGLGLFALAHAAFSAAQHRSYMRLTEKENETLPIDIVLQTLLAFVLAIYGIVHISGEFKDMDASSELKNKTEQTGSNQNRKRSGRPRCTTEQENKYISVQFEKQTPHKSSTGSFIK